MVLQVYMVSMVLWFYGYFGYKTVGIAQNVDFGRDGLSILYNGTFHILVTVRPKFRI